MTLKDESSKPEGVQHTPGEKRRTTTNSSRKSEATGPKHSRRSVVDVPGDESKI